MSFLTKSEQSTISFVNSSELDKLSKRDLVNQIKTNAGLRAYGYRKPVKVFLSVITKHQNNKIISKLK